MNTSIQASGANSEFLMARFDSPAPNTATSSSSSVSVPVTPDPFIEKKTHSREAKISSRLVAGIVLFVAFLAVVVGGVGGLIKAGKVSATNRLDDALAASSNVDMFLAGSAEGLLVQATIISVDPVALTLKAQYEFALSNFYSTNASANSLFYVPSKAINISIGSDIVKYAAGSPMIPTQGTILISGDVSLYPFDGYETTALAISATYGDSTNSIPIYLELFRIADGYTLAANLSETAGNLIDSPVEIIATVDLARGPTGKSLAMLMAVGMWVMTLCCVVLTAMLAYKNQPVQLPHLALMATVLFAMPNVRNTMPSAPVVGALIDETVLIWAMVLLAACLSSHFIRYLMAARRDYLDEVKNK
ncbi:hypothetical protein HDU82_003115 [Entophlyctis luteolus]|nr:hypothetical protein HDU82_003115 [Entophlyctis luteolus]